MLRLDYETASLADLEKVGTYNYAAHPSTLIRCLGWAIDDEEPDVWFPGQPMPDRLKDAMKGPCSAWYASFERLITAHCLPSRFPSPVFNDWWCSAAQARANSLPGKLADCAKVLGIPEQKGDTRLMKKLSDASYTPHPLELEELGEYCKQDVRTERAISTLLPALTPDEQYMYLLNEHINDRGVMVDREFVEAMLPYLEYANDLLNAELTEITGGAVTKFTQVERIKKYLNYTGSLGAREIEKLLEQAPNRVLEIRRDGAKSSTAKYNIILNQLSADDRLRGMFVYSGAGQTGRFSARAAQLHNLVRDVLPDAEERIEEIKTMTPQRYQLMHSEPIIHTASKLIRPALIAPPGQLFVIGDFSAVEAKGVPWLAGNQYEIDAWASGADRYVEDAANAFGVSEDEAVSLRQAGKVVRLAAQFGGKGGSLMAMSKSYGLDLSEADAHRMAGAWHEANPWVEQYGRTLEKAAKQAVRNPGEVFQVGEHIKYASEYLNNGVQVLRCLLPSGRVISYHDVELVPSQYGGHDLSAIKPSTGARARIWYGMVIENDTQAMCNDLLRYAMVLVDAEYPIVAHVHDELVVEVDANNADEHLARLQELMEQKPDWAKTFPLTAKLALADRYSK